MPRSGQSDESWIRRAVPLFWGRHPTSLHEIDVLVQLTRALGREGAARAMMNAPEFRQHWETLLADGLAVHRLGFSANAGCYGRTLVATETAELAERIRDTAPEDTVASTSPNFTMRDLFRSALVLDDLSPVFRAHLIADLARAMDSMHLMASMSQRLSYAQSFMSAYLGRRMTCLGCHNSEWSVTGNPIPALDRTWEVPGHFEAALFGDSSGIDEQRLTTFFRRKGVVAGYRYVHDNASEETIESERAKGIAPWSWDATCGLFYPPSAVWPDDSDVTTAHFIAPTDTHGSVWDLERRFRSGVAKLKAHGLKLGAERGGLAVDGEVAFAWLAAQALVDRTFKIAFGSRLTIANGFPRNVWQRDTLVELTRTFVDSGWSLKTLLVRIATHPWFNVAGPATGADPAPFPPVFNPYADESLPPEERRNTVGDTVARAPARVLLRSLFRALNWPMPAEFPIYYLAEEARLQRTVGVWLQNGDPGFDGTSFQSALGWEAQFGVCADRSVDPVCPLLPLLQLGEEAEATRCEICLSGDYACSWDARCCDIKFTDYCPTSCETGDNENLNLSVTPRPELPIGGDFLSRLPQWASGDATLADLVSAVKDRLLADPDVNDPIERAVIEDVIMAPLDRPASGDPELVNRLRRACGMFAASPAFQLLGLPREERLDRVRPAGASAVSPGASFAEICMARGEAMLGPGGVTCGPTTLTVTTGTRP